MIPIVEYPSVVTAALPAFDHVFTKPQKNNFCKYLTGLTLSSVHTISSMNSMFVGHSDPSAFNNFITDSTWSDEELEKARYNFALNGLNTSEAAREGECILLLDDTLAHKTGDHMEFAGSFFDDTDGTITWAHDIVSSNLVKGRASIPLDFQIYLKKDQLNSKYLASVSRIDDAKEEAAHIDEILSEESYKRKNEIARELITKAFDRNIPFSCVVADSAFLCPETVDLIESLKRKISWVFASKGDRLVQTPRGWISLSEWAKTIPDGKFKKVKTWYKKKKHLYWAYAHNVRMSSLGGRKVRVVISYNNPELKGDPKFICTNKLDWVEYKILKVYARRWKIDVFYRDSKQNLGLEDYEMRKIKGVRRHLQMVFIAHTLLEIGSGEGGSSSSSKLDAIKVEDSRRKKTPHHQKRDTIGSKRHMVYTEVLTSFINLVLQIAGKANYDARKITDIALSSRTELRRMLGNTGKITAIALSLGLGL